MYDSQKFEYSQPNIYSENKNIIQQHQVGHIFPRGTQNLSKTWPLCLTFLTKLQIYKINTNPLFYTVEISLKFTISFRLCK